uniref:Pre-mRNA polyadenylation factor Fip1 domain-containing protein n=1 Tax=Musa acuminata subsp. malaccensis TaxID=214687 RepID=A0A804K0X9_MUSAM|nr:PREDICTED: FIP1[V]-like protein [Musa acuminata subsp. malaccensis]
MEDDDEFGELYTDVLYPVAVAAPLPPSQPQPQSSSSASSLRGRPDPLRFAEEDDSEGGVKDGDKDGLLFDASRADPAVEPPSTAHQALSSGAAAAAAAEDDGEDDWMLGRAPPAVDPPDNWDDEDDAVSSRPAVGGDGEPRVLEDAEKEARVSGIPDRDGEIGESERSAAPEEPEEDGDRLFVGGVGENLGDLDQVPLIPGLSAGPAPSGPLVGMNSEMGKLSQSEDYDSDSEDDLQIVLNDSNHGPPGAERSNIVEFDEEDDEDGEEDLVIVTDEDQHHHLPAMEVQDWGEETLQPTGEGERKEMVDAAKGIGATGTAPGARIGYNNHGIHTQHHSMYKYIRPGAAPLPGDPAAGALGPPGAARPSLVSGPTAGHGRGDWRPASGRGIPSAPKSYHTNFGFPGWANGSARASGGGLDFTLPSHKTIFDVDIESFEEKPWKHPGVDISDFFNFGLDEDKWKDYCKRLDQLRLESTMQSKIRVYESGRSEQEYDPDLPPELAAAAGHDISANCGHVKADDEEIKFTGQGRGPAVMRAPLPTGRAIQVEGGYGERLPSIDTRPPRIRDSDAVIEIVLQDSFDDPKMYSCTPEQLERDVEGDCGRSFHKDEKDDRNTVSGYMNRIPHTSSTRDKEMIKRVPFAKEKDELLPLPSDSSAEYRRDSRTRSPVSAVDGASGIHQGGRLLKGSSSRKRSRAREQSADSIPSRSAHSSRNGDQQKETLLDSTEVNQNSQTLPAVADDTTRELGVEEQYHDQDEKLALVDSVEIEGDDVTSDFHISSETGGDDNLIHPGKKQKICSRVEQPAVQDRGYEDELQPPTSDNSREKSGSSKDCIRQAENGEVIQEGHSSQTGDLKKSQKEDEHNLHAKDEDGLDARQQREKNQIVSKGREDASISSQNLLRGRSYDRRKESESSTSSWQRRESNMHGRRSKDEDIRWENNEEMSRHQSKLRTIDRNQKDEDQSRKHVEGGEWRGHTRDEVLRQRERDDLLMSRRENMDNPLIKRKRDEEYLRGKADKVDTSHGHRDREDSGRRKRERDDGLHHKREVDTRMRDKADDHLSSKPKDDSWRHRERDERQRLKPHEVMHREREEGRVTVRSGRVTEDKPVGGNGRNRDELKPISYDKDYQEKERRRHTELSRRDRAREDNMSQNKGRGDTSVHDKHSNADGRSSRHEKLNTYVDHPPSADGQQMYREKHRENTSKAKDVKSHDQNNQRLGKRKHDDRHNSHKNEKVYIKESDEQESNNTSSMTLSKKNSHQIHEQREATQQHTTVKKQGEDDPVSDDENQGNRRGRSKLERWTSHKERDYDAINNSQTLSASSRGKKIEGNAVNVAKEDELVKTELSNNAGELDVKGADGGQVSVKMVDDQDRHLDTVAKLKRRSERFKLPMPREKEITSNKKMENEVQLSNNEAGLDSEVKPERPARKRRWTGS